MPRRIQPAGGALGRSPFTAPLTVLRAHPHNPVPSLGLCLALSLIKIVGHWLVLRTVGCSDKEEQCRAVGPGVTQLPVLVAGTAVGL